MSTPSNLKLSTQVSPELKAFSVPVVSILVVVLVVVFAILPLWKKVSAKQTQLNQDKKTLELLTLKEEELKKLDANKVNEQFQHAEVALPSAKEVPALLVGLSRLYQDQGLNLTALKIVPGSVATESAAPKDLAATANATPLSQAKVGVGNQIFPKNRRLDFDIVLSGTLEQALGFLKTMEKSVRLMTVNSFAFASSRSLSPTITLNMSAPFEPFPPLPKDYSDPLPRLTSTDQDVLNKVSSYTPVTTAFSGAVTNAPTNNNTNNPFGGQVVPVPRVTPRPATTVAPTTTPATRSATPAQ